MGSFEPMCVIITGRFALREDLFSLFFTDISVEIWKANAEILFHQREFGVISLVITVLVGTTAIVLNILVKTVLCPILKSGRLILDEF